MLELNLTEKEKTELFSAMENYYDDEVPGASGAFPVIKNKLKSGEGLSKEELKIIYNCLSRDIHDFLYQIEHKSSAKIYERINQKIDALIG